MDDLANKLRVEAKPLRDTGYHQTAALVTQAADALDAKDKQIAELEARIKHRHDNAALFDELTGQKRLISETPSAFEIMGGHFFPKEPTQ